MVLMKELGQFALFENNDAGFYNFEEKPVICMSLSFVPLLLIKLDDEAFAFVFNCSFMVTSVLSIPSDFKSCPVM